MEIEYKNAKKVLFSELNDFETFYDGSLHRVCIKVPGTYINGEAVNSIRISDGCEVIEYGHVLYSDIVWRVKVKMIVEA